MRFTPEQQDALDFLSDGSASAVPDENAAGRHLQVLRESKPAFIIPALATLFLRSADPRMKSRISDLLVTLADLLPVKAWPVTDQAIRVTAWDMKADTSDPAAELISLCHPAGRIREAALKEPRFRLPLMIRASLLLVRLNDWAEPVRHAAASGLKAILSTIDAQEKLRLLPLVNHLLLCGRLQDRSILERWMDGPFDKAAWLSVWKGAAAGTRRLYLSILLPQEACDPEIRMALLKSNDRLALSFFTRKVLPELLPHERAGAESILFRSRLVPVRAAWMEYLLEHDPALAISPLWELTISHSRSLRSFARFHLSRREAVDFTAHYLTALSETSSEEGAFLGLSDVAPEIAHEKALERLASPNLRLRKAAILALSDEWVKANLDWFLSENRWSKPAANYAVRKRLRAIPRALGSFILRQAGEFPPPSAASSFLISQSPYFQKWQALEYILRLLNQRAYQGEIETAFRAWRSRESRSYVRLPADRKAKLRELLESSSLPRRDMEQILFLLRKAE